MKRKSRQSVLTAVRMALLSTMVGYLMFDTKDSGAVHANPGAMNEKAAASVGARVLPTAPLLKVEPK
ncbi:hypothetical protein [Bradyrhizobium sp. McL0616]|uniref:hypothetical protein n=1 Tax=Bradyrhizobium sp. McL0616 TaxID=3415674 RepID=UPI003CEAC0E3